MAFAKRSMLATCAVILCAHPRPARADEAATPPSAVTIGQVVVTARRIPEGLQRTPAEVAALSARELSDKAVRRSDDLKFLVPALQVVPVQGGASVDFA